MAAPTTLTASPSLTASPLTDLQALGQSVWFDNMRRALLTSGELQPMVHEDGLSGLTSNPSIFEKANVGSTDYDAALAELRGTPGLDVKSVYEGLAIVDLRAAADISCTRPAKSLRTIGCWPA
jgi:transaldolase